jgi:hypothetical protein
MNIKFKDVNPGMYPAKITGIKEQNGPYGEYWRLNFTILQGELRAAGLVLLFYRWMVILMGEEPDDHFALEQLMGKQCRIYLQKKTKGDKKAIKFIIRSMTWHRMINRKTKKRI